VIVPLRVALVKRVAADEAEPEPKVMPAPDPLHDTVYGGVPPLMLGVNEDVAEGLVVSELTLIVDDEGERETETLA
jgi:hypothetical protein